MPSIFKKNLDSFKTQKKAKGPVTKWTDTALLKIRDRFRKQARKERGNWTLDFYETLQVLNKESTKRGLKAGTA